LGPIDRVTPYFWTPAPTQDRIYKVIQIWPGLICV
jgi:hypothetical protein